MGFELFIGPGLSFGKFHNKQVDVLVNGSLGLGGKYNINKYWAIDLEARTHLLPTFFYTNKYTGSEEIAGRSYQDGLLSLSIGATYTFGGKKFTRYESGGERVRPTVERQDQRSGIGIAEHTIPVRGCQSCRASGSKGTCLDRG